MARMKTRLLRSFIGLTLMTAAISGISQEIQKLDPALDQIVPAKATLERVATGFDKWTEGPAWTREGSLMFAEIPANNIVKLVPGQGELFSYTRVGTKE